MRERDDNSSKQVQPDTQMCEEEEVVLSPPWAAENLAFRTDTADMKDVTIAYRTGGSRQAITAVDRSRAGVF